MNLKQKIRKRAKADAAAAKKMAEKDKKASEARLSAEIRHARTEVVGMLEDIGLEELTGGLTFVKIKSYDPPGGGPPRNEGYIFKTSRTGIPTLFLRFHVGSVRVGWNESTDDAQLGPGFHEWLVKKIGE